MESEPSIRSARRRWFSQVAFKSLVQTQVPRRRWETKRFNAGAGCTHQTLHLHGYVSTCDLESIFTPSSLARHDSTSTAAFGNGGLGEDGGEMQRERSGVGCPGLAWQVLQPFIKAVWRVFQKWGEWASERTHMKPSQQTFNTVGSCCFKAHFNPALTGSLTSSHIVLLFLQFIFATSDIGGCRCRSLLCQSQPRSSAL